MRTYAYVTSETCARTRAFEPGDEYQGQTVSRHGDLYPWRMGKRATLAAMELDGAANQHTRRAARAVAELKGWV